MGKDKNDKNVSTEQESVQENEEIVAEETETVQETVVDESSADEKIKEAADIARAAREKAAAEELAKKLETLICEIPAKAGSGGRLFGSITTSDISAALAKQHKIEIDKHKIEISETIKQFGTYEVKVKLYPQVSGKLRVKVREA